MQVWTIKCKESNQNVNISEEEEKEETNCGQEGEREQKMMECKLRNDHIQLEPVRTQSLNLANPNKTRIKGPTGRKLPTRNLKYQDNQNNVIKHNNVEASCGGKQQVVLYCDPSKDDQNKPSDYKHDSHRDYTSVSGNIDPAEFDKVWFICIPRMSSLANMENKAESKGNSFAMQNINANLFIQDELKKNGRNLLLDEKSEKELDFVKSKNKDLKMWKKCSIL